MARGDVVSEIASTAHNNTITFQPDSGTEVVIKAAGGVSSVAACTVGISDGTNHSTFVNMGLNAGNLSIPINHAHYFYALNASGGTNPMGYSGYITKQG